MALTARQKSSKSTLLPAGFDEAVHAQARRPVAVARLLDEVAEAIEHVVHAHDGGRRDRVLDDGVARGGARVGQHRLAQPRVARGDRASRRHAPTLLDAEAALREDRLQVEAEVARRLRDGVPERLERAHGQLASSVALALLPVARAELVGLQGVEHAQDLVDVAAHVEVGDATRSG